MKDNSYSTRQQIKYHTTLIISSKILYNVDAYSSAYHRASATRANEHISSAISASSELSKITMQKLTNKIRK